MKKLFKKICNWLTGLRKYYPAHIFVLLVLLISVPLYLFFIFDCILHPDEETIFLDSAFMFVIYELVIYVSLIIALIFAGFLYHISKNIKMKIYVDIETLSEKVLYDFLFMLTITFAIFSQMLIIISVFCGNVVMAADCITNIFSAPLFIIEYIYQLIVHHI